MGIGFIAENDKKKFIDFFGFFQGPWAAPIGPTFSILDFPGVRRSQNFKDVGPVPENLIKEDMF